MSWEKRGDALEFKFEKKGETLMGQLIDMKTTRFESKAYTLITATGESYYFFGCFRLDAMLPALINKYIRITYKGKKKLPNKQTLRDYDIEVWKSEDGKVPEGFFEEVPF